MNIKNLRKFFLNPALMLTMFRLICSLTVLPFILIYFLPQNNFPVNLIIGLIFAFIASTDFFDGLVARNYHCATKVGSILDYLSDKLLLISSMLCLVWLKKIFVYWAIIFIARELIITTVRQLAVLFNFEIVVNNSGKLKTVCQFLYIFISIINPQINTNLFLQFLNLVEFLFLYIALLATVYSGYNYIYEFYKKFQSASTQNY